MRTRRSIGLRIPSRCQWTLTVAHGVVRVVRWLVALVVVGFPGFAAAQRWQDATPSCLPATSEWSNKIELADVDGDGLLDILVANGGNYSSPGTPQPARVWKNLGNWSQPGSHCTEISAQAVGGFVGLSRMIKVADVDGDGQPDIITGGAHHTQLKLFLRRGDSWIDASAQLPQQMTSIGDAEFGDVDGDGDLDIVLADWGAQDPGASGYTGGRTRLYLNDGHGNFTEATATQMPDILVKWSWDIELVDVDNDWDLDILVSCKLCSTSYLFRNDGTGHFTDDPMGLPHFTNNYELEAMDVDGDGWLDLATINDGLGGRDHLFMNHNGNFVDESSTRLFGTANPAEDDNAAVWLDANDDGFPDLLVASLSGPDRLSLNDGQGHFTLAPNATPSDTPGSLGIAVGDLDGDGRDDVVQAQGEAAFGDKVQLASSMVAVDTHPPVIAVEEVHAGGATVHARVHDRRTPSRISDWQSVSLLVDGNPTAMAWYGELLWTAKLPAVWSKYQVCATDRHGNQACSQEIGFNGGEFPPIDDDSNQFPPKGGGCCDGGDARGSIVLALVVLVSATGRSRARRSGSSSRDPR
jgi:hypothetical protein